MRCPGFEELIDHIDRRLESSDESRIREHLASGCRKCAANVAWYKNFRSLVRESHGFDPPHWAHDHAIRIFDAHRKERPGSSVPVSLLAQLSYDNLTNHVLAGARSAEAAERQLVFQAGEFTIDLQIAPSEASGAEIIGQILRDGEVGFDSVAGVLVELTANDEALWSTVTNDTGEFMMIGVGAGEYGLFVATAEQAIRIPFLPVYL